MASLCPRLTPSTRHMPNTNGRPITTSKTSITSRMKVIRPSITSNLSNIISNRRAIPPISINITKITSDWSRLKCGENRNHGKFKIYFLMVEL